MSFRVLVVDDQQQKLEQLLKILADAGIQRENIEIAQTGFDAREKLRRQQYELMILDLALPLRAENQPDGNEGIALLGELHEREGYKRPSHIIVVTAREDLARTHSELLSERLIHLLQFDFTSDRWRRQLKTFVSDAQAIQIPREARSSRKDVCIVTALRDPELRAVRDLPWGFGEARLLTPSSFFHEGSIVASGERYSVVAAAAARMGTVATALLTQRMLEEFRPKVLVMVGICAGVSGRVNLGDPVLISPAWDWQSGKRVREDNRVILRVDPHHLEASPQVIAYFQQFIEDQRIWSKISSEWKGPRPKTELKGHVGPVSSGSAVLADGVTIDEIKNFQHRKLLGVEMEAYGFYAAAHEKPHGQPLSFAIKSVCDFADEKKGDECQAYAAYTSAQAVRHFLEAHIAGLIRVES
ncbi:response regulator [Myxococcus xanthus]|uniref:phosphorylase family protein n=1 Tax=Myxococcus xanthus TaxID=34 RepID=UPI00112D3757|nr:response regulator [Myxococcus xanthus]